MENQQIRAPQFGMRAVAPVRQGDAKVVAEEPRQVPVHRKVDEFLAAATAKKLGYAELVKKAHELDVAWVKAVKRALAEHREDKEREAAEVRRIGKTARRKAALAAGLQTARTNVGGAGHVKGPGGQVAKTCSNRERAAKRARKLAQRKK